MPDYTASPLAPDVLLRHARTVDLEQGQALFEQGSYGDTAYWVVAGTVKITQRPGDAPGSVLAVLGPGDVLGASCLFVGGTRTASAYALTAVKLRELDSKVLNELVKSHPEVATWLIEQLAQRLRRANHAIADFMASHVPSRLARVLLDLADQSGCVDGRVVRIDHGLTQREIAQLCGASRETVNKSLGAFVARGWIAIESGSTRILNMDALMRRAGRVEPVQGASAVS